MYTSFSKIDDRFGFNTSGTFKCAYENTRTLIFAGLIVLGIIAVLILINVIYLFFVIQGAPANSAQKFNEIINGDLEKIKDGLDLFGDVTTIGFTIVGTIFGIILFMLAVIGFIILCATLKMGHTYSFKADEQVFAITFPKKMNKTVAIEYDYILGLQYEEWHFIFAPKCLDVTIQTKEGNFTFRLIHTPMSRANGITETPFNIIRERIGIAEKDETVLINKDAAK